MGVAIIARLLSSTLTNFKLILVLMRVDKCFSRLTSHKTYTRNEFAISWYFFKEKVHKVQIRILVNILSKFNFRFNQPSFSLDQDGELRKLSFELFCNSHATLFLV